MVGSDLCKMRAKSESFGRELDRSVAVFGPGVTMLLNDDVVLPDPWPLVHAYQREFLGLRRAPKG